MSNEHEIRDAVIKLEVRMEQVTEMLSALTLSVNGIIDITYEIREAKRDINHLTVSLQEVTKRLTEVEGYSSKNTFINKGLLHSVWLIVAAIISYVSYRMK